MNQSLNQSISISHFLPRNQTSNLSTLNDLSPFFEVLTFGDFVRSLSTKADEFEARRPIDVSEIIYNREDMVSGTTPSMHCV